VPETRILLVEDEFDVRETISFLLRENGYIVDTVSTATDAQTRLIADRYAVVITDWKLPDGDGTLIADWASQLGAKSVVMSGHLGAMPGGRADGHPTLMKPFRSRQLLEAVQEALDGVTN
jgi:DNA-binding response OmpR family regulator